MNFHKIRISTHCGGDRATEQNVMQIANITLPRVKASGAENPFLKPIRQKTLSVKCDQGKPFSRMIML